jgi:putative PIN family toxin of toxin-antitoxin system
MTERRWVVDTNVLLSRLLCPGGAAAQAVDRALEPGVLLVSEDTLSELVEVMNRPKFDRYLSRDDRRRFVELLGGVARLVPIGRQVQACRDPRDDKFLDVAVNGEAQQGNGTNGRRIANSSTSGILECANNRPTGAPTPSGQAICRINAYSAPSSPAQPLASGAPGYRSSSWRGRTVSRCRSRCGKATVMPAALNFSLTASLSVLMVV